MKIVYPDRNSYIQLDQINRAAQQDPAELVRRCEAGFETQLDVLVRSFTARRGEKFLMLSGPSSSGKTTTAHKLSERFERMGRRAPVVSLDEFFLGIDQYPRLPDGSPDMESVYALDIPLLRRCLSDLAERGSAIFPRFDFATSSRAGLDNLIELGPDDLLIIEGIHALNPILTDNLDPSARYLAYISTRTRVLSGEKTVYAPKDARLILRMIRDQNFRGYPALNTLLKWQNVLDGEELYIYPYRDTVDFKIDSSLEYEGGIFHRFLSEVMRELDANNPQHEELSRLLSCLDYFVEIPVELVPKNSLLREFIGTDH